MVLRQPMDIVNACGLSTSRDDFQPIGTKGGRGTAVLITQPNQLPPRSHVPDADGRVMGSSDDLRAIGAEGSRLDPFPVLEPS
jgi:hypothetical protein